MIRSIVASSLVGVSLSCCTPSPAADAAADVSSASDVGRGDGTDGAMDATTADATSTDATTVDAVSSDDVSLDATSADATTADVRIDAVSSADDGGDGGRTEDVALADGCRRPPVAMPADDGGACAAGQTSCGGSCVDLRTDRLNCGGCGLACAAGLLCTGGICSCACTPPFTCCTDTCLLTRFCANPLSDARHCGACFRACAAGQSCVMGECR